MIDFEWLGSGQVRVGFVMDGAIVYVHKFQHANELTGVYMSTPNLPVRWEIDNDGTGGAASFDAICSTVISEGGQANTGFTRSIDTQATALSFNSSAIQPILAVRLKSTALHAAAGVERFEILATSSGVFRWVVLEDPSVVGTALSFSSVAADSILEVARPTSATTVTGGFQEASGYKESTNSGSATIDLALDVPLGSYIDGTPQVYVFGVQRVEGTGTETVYAAVTMREQV